MMNAKVMEISRQLSEIGRKIDAWLESLSEISALFFDPVYLSIHTIYTRLDKKKDLRVINLYDVYPMFFIEVPVIRGVRFSGKTLKISPGTLIKLNTLKRMREGAKIYKKYPYTLITYANVEYKKISEELMSFVYYTLQMYFKPIIFIEEKSVAGKKIYYDYIFPNPCSLVCIGREDYDTKTIISPFTSFFILLTKERRIINKSPFGKNFKCYCVKSYLFAVNPSTYDVKYLGPFPTLIPEDLADDGLIKLMKDSKDAIFGFFGGFLVYESPPVLWFHNIIKKDFSQEGYILLIFEQPLIPLEYYFKLFSAINIGNYILEFEDYVNELKYAAGRIPFVPVFQGSSQIAENLERNFYSAQNRYEHKYKGKKYDEMNFKMEDRLMRQLLEGFFEQIFLESGVNIKIFDLLFFLYAYQAESTPKELYNELRRDLSIIKNLSMWPSRDEYKEIVSLNKYSRVNKKINEIIRDLVNKYDLWIVL